MKYSDFEKHIGTELGAAKEAVDMKQLLQGLDLGGLPEKKSGRPFFFWMLIPLILIGSYVTFLAMDGNQSLAVIENDQKNKIDKNSSYNLSLEEDQNINQQTIDGKKILANEIISQEIEQTINEQKANNNSISKQEDLASNTSEEIKTHFDDTSLNFRSNSKSTQIQKKTSLTSAIDDFSDSPINDQSSYLSNDKDGSVTIDNNKKLSFYKSTEDKETSLFARPSIELSSISNRSINITDLNIESDDMFSRMKINCPSFNQAHWRLALIPEVGIFNPFKTIENKRQEDIQAFEERQKYETTLEGINFGLYTMLVRDKLPVYIKAGVSYSRITERTDLEYNYTVQDTTIGIISQTVSANGDSITTIMGPIISEKTFTGKNRQHHYIHLFDLPVSVGYNAYIAGMDIGLEAGVKINLMTRATGNLLTSTSGYTNLSLNQYYNRRIGLSYFGGIMIGRNFGRLGDFYIAPRFNYYPSDFSNETNAISQKYVTMGLNVGYVYKLK